MFEVFKKLGGKEHVRTDFKKDEEIFQRTN